MSTPAPLPRSTPLGWLRRSRPLDTRLQAAIRDGAPDRLTERQAVTRLSEIQQQLDRTTSRRRMSDLYVAATETYVSAPRDPATDVAMGRIEGRAEAARAAGTITTTPFTALLRDYARDPNPPHDAAPIVDADDVSSVLGTELTQKHRLLQSVTGGTRAGLRARDDLADRIGRSPQPAIITHDALAADNEHLDQLTDRLKVGEIDAVFAANVAATVHAKWGGIADAIVERAERLGSYATTEAPFTVADFADLATSRQHRELQQRADVGEGFGWDESRNTISRGFVTHPAGFGTDLPQEMAAAIREGVAAGAELQAERHATGKSGRELVDETIDDDMLMHDFYVEATYTNAAAEVEFIGQDDRIATAIAVAHRAGERYAAWADVADGTAAQAAALGGLALREAGLAGPDNAAANATFRTHADAAIAEQDAADPSAAARRVELRARLDSAYPAPMSDATPPRVATRMEQSAARAPWKPYQPAPASAAFAATGVPPRGADLSR